MKTPDRSLPGGEGLSPAQRELLAQARVLRPWSIRARAHAWEAIVTRAETSQRPQRSAWGLALGGSLGVATVALVAMLAPGETAQLAAVQPAEPPGQTEQAASRTVANSWTRAALEGGDTLELSPGARYAVEQVALEGGSERRVRLEAGAVTAEVAKRAPGSRFAVVTPHLRVEVVGTRFTVNIERALTAVTVAEGVVRVQAPSGASVLLHAGDSIASDDARFAAPAIARPAALPQLPPELAAGGAPVDTAARRAAESTPCHQETGAARRACLERAAQGHGLAAQNALYALGLLESGSGGDPLRANAHWRAYQQRFPDGVFAPEVSLSILSLALREGDRAAAASEAGLFLERYPGDGRAGGVKRLYDALGSSDAAR